MAAGRMRPGERVLYIPQLEERKIRIRLTNKTIGEVKRRENTEKRAIGGPRIT
jgi:hypothetical protein